MTERRLNKGGSPRARTPVDELPEEEVEERPVAAPAVVGRRRGSALVSEMPSKSERARRNIEDQLVGFGYKPMQWIFAQDDDGSEAPSYILADLFGDKVLIELDTTIPRVAVLGRDLRVRHNLKGTVAPPVTPSGEDLTVCGAASLGSGGFCALSRNPESQDLEPRHFSVVSKPKEEAAILGDPALPIPVVRLSQIQENNKLVMATIIHQTGRFRLGAIAQLEVRKLAFLKAVSELNKAAQIIANTHEGAFTLANVQLQSYFLKIQAKKSNLSFPPASDALKVEFDEVIDYCRLCNGGFEKLVVESGHLLNLTQEVGEMIDDLNQMLSSVKKCSQ